MFNQDKIRRIITILTAIFVGISAGTISYSQVLNVPDQVVTNWIYDHTVVKTLDSRITVIAIDSKSELIYGSYDTWSRTLLADAVTELSEQNATVIGLDLNLSEESVDTTGDLALADACSNANNVIATANAQHEPPSEDYLGDVSVQQISEINYPYKELRPNVKTGIANATQESSDGIVRNAALTVSHENTQHDSFAVAVYKAYQNALGMEYTLPKLNENELFGFNTLTGQINCNVISFSDLLNGLYDSSLIDGHIVLIGEYKQNIISSFQNIINPAQEQQEVLMQASIIQALLNQSTISPVNPLLQAIIYGLLICIVYLIIASRKIWVTILASIILVNGVVAIGLFANYKGYRFSLLVPILYFIIVLLLSLMQRYIISLLEKKQMERTLKMYVEPKVVDQITEKMPYELSHLSERRHIAVLFVDIRGFTTISESLEPEQVVEILNEYLTLVATTIQRWGGTLDKFIGDAAMAFFNAPNDQEDYIFRAVCAAYEISKNADYLRNKYEMRYGKPVTFGIGVNCGDAIVGNIGSLNRMDYTAIGDTVNTASRLEGNAKAGQILISEKVYHAVSNRINASYVGSLSLKGKTKTVETYQVDNIPGILNPASHKRGILNEALVLHSKLRPHI